MVKRTTRYLTNKRLARGAAINSAAQVAESTDNKIDQDFPGFPNGQAKPEIIKPKTKQQKKIAALNIKDGEKMNYDEQASDASGGAFATTEEISD